MRRMMGISAAMLLAVAVLASFVTGCVNTSYAPKGEFAVSRAKPTLEMAPGQSLQLQRVEADGTVVLKDMGDGKLYACKAGGITPAAKDTVGVEILRADASLQTAQVRMYTMVKVRAVWP